MELETDLEPQFWNPRKMKDMESQNKISHTRKSTSTREDNKHSYQFLVDQHGVPIGQIKQKLKKIKKKLQKQKRQRKLVKEVKEVVASTAETSKARKGKYSASNYLRGLD